MSQRQRLRAARYDEQSNEEDNWLVAYVDLLTNLLAFFVLLFALANVPEYRFEVLSRTFSKEKTYGVNDVAETVNQLVAHQDLEDQIETVLDGQGLSIRFKTRVLFDSASADLAANADQLLQPLADALLKLQRPYDVVIEGHTDDQPIHNEQFASNWELSAKRGINVVERLIAHGIPRTRLSAQAFSDTRPLDDNDRANNRRVVVRVR